MLTRTQKDDLRFVHDCLLAGGDLASEAFVQWLCGLNPRLVPILPAAAKARRLFLPHAIELILASADGPCEAREQILDFGRLLAAVDIRELQFRAAEQKLFHLLAEQLGGVYSDRVRETLRVAVVAASAWLRDGMSKASGMAENEEFEERSA